MSRRGYQRHTGIVQRVLDGAMPGNRLALLGRFGLSYDTWGKDVARGAYPWIPEPQR